MVYNLRDSSIANQIDNNTIFNMSNSSNDSSDGLDQKKIASLGKFLQGRKYKVLDEGKSGRGVKMILCQYSTSLLQFLENIEAATERASTLASRLPQLVPTRSMVQEPTASSMKQAMGVDPESTEEGTVQPGRWQWLVRLRCDKDASDSK